jgi:hypothetical protein
MRFHPGHRLLDPPSIPPWLPPNPVWGTDYPPAEIFPGFVSITDYDNDASSVYLPLIFEGLRSLPVKPAFECAHFA